jgi:mannose-6-phosphate isomerase-like protein (cupin superfamily)
MPADTALVKSLESSDNVGAMNNFALSQLCGEQARSGRRYLEFLRVPALSTGLYVLPVGAMDTQQPHTEDEVYYVVRGRARVRVAEEDRDVEPGTIVFVKATVPHHFHTITEELTLLVFFAPAEGTVHTGSP